MTTSLLFKKPKTKNILSAAASLRSMSRGQKGYRLFINQHRCVLLKLKPKLLPFGFACVIIC